MLFNETIQNRNFDRYDELCELIRNRDTEGIKRMLAGMTPLEMQRVEDCAPEKSLLVIALGHWYTDAGIVRMLLEAGADPNPVGGRRPLFCALENLELTEMLLHAGADPNVWNDRGYTPLLKAVHSGSIDIVRKLIDHGADVAVYSIEDDDDRGCNVFNYAAFAGDSEQVKFLASCPGAPDINHNSSSFRQYSTGLAHSVYKRNRKMVEAFLECGAAADTVPESGFSDDCNDGKTLLHKAVEQAHLGILSLLVKHGADVNRADRYGCTPLHLAIELKYVDCMRRLLKHGADPNQPDKIGQTPLHYAASIESGTWYEGDDICRPLLDAGADPNFMDSHGRTPLVLSRTCGISELLKSGGADPALASEYEKDHTWEECFELHNAKKIDAS